MKKVLVTGGTGFLAGWTIRELLEKGYAVRTTVRSMKKSENVTSMLEKEGVDTSRLSFAVADLTNPDGWDDAMKDVDFVLHVASPLGGNNHEDPTLIPTAKSGVENVLGAAIRTGVKKVVMTSSEAANYPDKKDPNPAVNEDFWTDMNNKWITNYQRPKIIAERTAWEIIEKQNQTNLATILPGAILGPNMAGKRSSTDQIFEMLLKRTPSPNVIYPVGDVRDLAELHILAMENDAADGQRFIAESEEMTMPEMARILKAAYPDRKLSTIVIPDFVISVMAKFQVPMKVLNTMVGLKYHRDSTKARKLLGWNPRPAKETVLDTAQYLIDNRIV
ncbi:MAG: NAD-dependent epimerase/dehydratase family protein [Eubacteriales bacterium]|jgi:dihydroflavonol-4-reductase